MEQLITQSRLGLAPMQTAPPPEPEPEPEPEPKPEPEPEPAPQPQPEPEPEPEPEPRPEPQPRMQTTPPQTNSSAQQSTGRPARSSPGAGTVNETPINLPSIRAAYKNNPLPTYPWRARRLGHEGRVLLRVHITVSGRVDRIAIKKSSGHESLDQAALAAVRDWRFEPARRAGHPVPAWVVVPIHFQLN